VSIEHVDLLIVGAGLSGVGAGHQFGKTFPGKTYAILEQRGELGGTWSLFRYPGVRSDSDMHTLGYRFKPWTAAKAIADGPSILDYVKETAREGNVLDKICYHQKVVRADWSTDDAVWTVTTRHTETGETAQLTSNFLLMCSGYYNYETPYQAHFEGRDRFRGQILHPQFWPEDLDYAGKKVVVIGSGATAVTIVPAMADRAAHVTMLQRTPTYIVALPGTDAVADRLRKFLPMKLVYGIVRWKNVIRILLGYQLSRRRPEFMKRAIKKMTLPHLPEGFDYDTHLTPPYNPWDQRMCLVPDGDLFVSLKEGKASIVTDTIETFTETGIKLTSGKELEADIVVTATGLQLIAQGGVEMYVDGERVEVAKHMAYKSIMLSDVPNMAYAFGYTNASWTLKVDLTYDYVWRLMKRMDEGGFAWCMPKGDPSVEEQPFVDFTSGYIQRSLDQLPKGGARAPWKLKMNYAMDLLVLRFSSLDDGAMTFGGSRSRIRTGEVAKKAS
jgi:cation diffusion facilitator CzcD-associated flavoprotein CzcO